VNVIDASGSVKHVGVIVFLHLASDQPYVEIEVVQEDGTTERITVDLRTNRLQLNANPRLVARAPAIVSHRPNGTMKLRPGSPLHLEWFASAQLRYFTFELFRCVEQVGRYVLNDAVFLLAAEQFVPGEPNDNLRRLTLYLPEGSYSGHYSVCIRSGEFSHHTHVLEVINPAAPALRNGQLMDALQEDDVAEHRLSGLVQPATEDHSAYVDVEWSFRLDQTQEVLLLLRNICVADSAHKVSFGEGEDVQTTVFGVINCDQLAVGRARVYLPSPRGGQNFQDDDVQVTFFIHQRGDRSQTRGPELAHPVALQ